MLKKPEAKGLIQLAEIMKKALEQIGSDLTKKAELLKKISDAKKNHIPIVREENIETIDNKRT